jgi:ABC-type multidrug transport system ATPase subunit
VRGAAPQPPAPGEGAEDDEVRGAREAVGALAEAAGGVARVGGGTGMTLLHLRKEYPPPPPRATPKVAVADACLRVEEGAIFGLLGPNGAGKSTLLSMLVGEVAPSGGAAALCGVPVGAGALPLVGFCAQGDALYPQLTAKEMLVFYAALNGAPPAALEPLAAAALRSLGLSHFGGARCGTLSGGNKRRLSLAIAYVAAPRVVLLDEPSTGVDPAARRRMFDVVQGGRAARSTLLTTHVIEDADALCDDIGVLVAGRFACLGAPSHLKARYGTGFTIEARFGGGGGGRAGEGGAEERDPALALVDALVAGGAGAGVRLATRTPSHALIEAPNGLRHSAAFGVLDRARATLGVEDYGVSVASLEQVFLRFSRMQEEAGAGRV